MEFCSDLAQLENRSCAPGGDRGSLCLLTPRTAPREPLFRQHRPKAVRSLQVRAFNRLAVETAGMSAEPLWAGRKAGPRLRLSRCDSDTRAPAHTIFHNIAVDGQRGCRHSQNSASVRSGGNDEPSHWVAACGDCGPFSPRLCVGSGRRHEVQQAGYLAGSSSNVIAGTLFFGMVGAAVAASSTQEALKDPKNYHRRPSMPKAG